MKIALMLGMLAMMSAGSAVADTRERVMTITTDAFAGTFTIDVVRDTTGAMTEMLFQTPTSPHGVLTVAQLSQGPQVIFTKSGHDVFLLSAESDFTPEKGGHLIVRFLHNGIDDAYKDFRILVDVEKTMVLRSDPNSTDPDSDNNPFTGVFNQLFMEKNTTFGMVVGVSEVIPSYQ